eukprot:COSAG02_NODE_3797_length_6216_cov_4.330227_3_plen_231_part_00
MQPQNHEAKSYEAAPGGDEYTFPPALAAVSCPSAPPPLLGGVSGAAGADAGRRSAVFKCSCSNLGMLTLRSGAGRSPSWQRNVCTHGTRSRGMWFRCPQPAMHRTRRPAGSESMAWHKRSMRRLFKQDVRCVFCGTYQTTYRKMYPVVVVSSPDLQVLVSLPTWQEMQSPEGCATPCELRSRTSGSLTCKPLVPAENGQRAQHHCVQLSFGQCWCGRTIAEKTSGHAPRG